MAIYNIESPGGYQLIGVTVPGVDVLGSKAGYSLSRPWLFEDFDQLTFYKVSEEEYEKQLAIFHSGLYEYEIEECEFDMAEHNKLLRDTKDEVKVMKERQRRAQEEMDELEKELIEKWTIEKAEGKIPVDKVEALLNGITTHSCSLSLVLMLRSFFLRSHHVQNRKPPKRQCLEGHGQRGR